MNEPRLPTLRKLLKAHWREEYGQFQYVTPLCRYGELHKREARKWKPLAGYIRDHCAAAMNLRVFALTAYSRLASFRKPRRLGSPKIIPAYLFLHSAWSCMDALGCVIHAVMTGQGPGRPEEDSPTLFGIPGKLKLREFDPLAIKLEALRTCRWVSELKTARHRITHRGYWPMGHGLIKSPGHFGIMEWYEDPQRQIDHARIGGVISASATIDYALIAKGFIEGLEAWEMEVLPLVEKEQQFKPRAHALLQGIMPQWWMLGILNGHNNHFGRLNKRQLSFFLRQRASGKWEPTRP